ncbi:hypothetical protein HG535_0B01710 [Zygotorulaspora mrakii]|uniref:Major facilitator superfamily (MFS) profile domain-containing protein n=1 Tax=Zygotorulaspora mrakii TaxID=42260 RepID=A0A7H9AY67_ZYGMR|nr:uncharacterized protein HG535_0B01710 [Zygotorulaspora mrakii]QLG71133.1 hypothetical protein HG535_0B01710 [Zygotorulaspora mrakii]
MGEDRYELDSFNSTPADMSTATPDSNFYDVEDRQGKSGTKVEQESFEGAEQEDLELDLRDPHTFPLVLASLWTSSALSALDGTIVSTTINDVASRFQQASLVTWVATSYLLTTCSAQPLYGKISDIIGRRKCLLFGQFVFAIGIIFCSVARTIPQLAIARAICGIGGSGTSAMTNIILSDMVPLSERAKYWGYGSVLWAIFQSIGGPLGGILLEYFGVSGLFIPQIPFCIAPLYLSWKYVWDYNEDTKKSWKKIDFGGSLCLLLMISSFIVLLSNNNDGSLEHVSWPPHKKASLVIFVSSLLTFAFVENYVAVENIIPFSVIKGTLGLVAIIYGLVALINYTCLFVVPLYLQLIWGVSVSQSGWYIMCVVISSAAGALWSGWIVKKFSNTDRHATIYYSAVLLFLMTLLTLFGYAGIYQAVRNSSPVMAGDKINPFFNVRMIFGISTLGFSQGSQNVTVMLFNVAKVGRKGQASSTSVNFLFRSLGNVLSVSIALTMFTNSLRGELSEALLGKDDDLLLTLLKDNAYLRSPSMPATHIKTIMDAFRKSLLNSFLPCRWSVILNVLFGIFLLIVVNRKLRRIIT